MRHVLGFILAIGLAAAVFFGGAWGFLRALQLPAADITRGGVTALPAGGGSLLHNRETLLAFAALAGVGLLAGLLVAVPWVSPLATGLPGLVFIAWTVVYGVSVSKAVRFIPLKTQSYGAGFEELLFSGILGLLGIVFIIPLFVPSRWSRGVSGDDEDASGLLADFNTTTAL